MKPLDYEMDVIRCMTIDLVQERVHHTFVHQGVVMMMIFETIAQVAF